MPSPAPSEAPTWGFRSRLPWPAASGERLWEQLTSTKGLSQYDVELCEPSAGHIALVLVKKQAATAAPGTPGPAPSTGGAGSPPLGRRGSTPLATAAAHTGAAVSPRVVFVLDAIPPPRKATSPAKVQQKQSASQSLRSLSPASTGSTMSSSGGSALADSTGGGLLPQLQQDVDELDLIDELLAAPKVGKDGAILAKSPLLSARFDCKVVAIKFMRGNANSTSTSLSGSNNSSTNSTTTTLRCVVAREDGMAFLWEWGNDLHQWSFLNQFCFLENPNLKWTKPVVAFTATEMAWHGETTEFAWWSMESKQEPKLCLRRIQYAQEQSTFRTEITIGNPFSLTCTQVISLRSSKLGLWIVTRTMGVHFRSAESLRMVSLSWLAVLSGDKSSSGEDDTVRAATVDPASQLLTCLHNVTGELLVLVRGSGAVHLVSSKDPKHPQQPQQGLRAKHITTLGSWSSAMAQGAVSIAAHRYLLLITTSETLLAFSYLTGEQLAAIELPHSSPENFHPSSKAAVRSLPPALWTITGAASSVGLWSSSGFWFIQTPSAKAISSSLNPLITSSSQRLTQQQQQQQIDFGNPRAAFESLVKYGESLKFETALQALEILEKVCKSLDACDEQVLRTVFQSLSSPALLLAVFADQNVPEALVDELARIVASLHQIAHEITVGGRFASSWEKGDAPGISRYQYSAAQKLTPANVEALHHLSNWVLLAKRKITRLQTSAYFKGRHHMRPRAVSALTTVASDDPGAPFSTFSPLESDEDPDGANFRLSRKLRPMSSLRFASGSCALHHGKQWLVQLESFLLDGVAFKNKSIEGNNSHGAVPSHLLFHEERQLEDYRSSNSSFSKHMYVESMSRLYLLHEPASLLPFVRCVSEYCPRLFSLSGATRVSRSHAERALTLFPPLELFVERFAREQLQQQQQLLISSSTKTVSQSQKKKQRHKELGVALAKDSLLAYTALLCRCGYYLEACHGLLQCDLYEHCRETLLVHLLKDSEHRDDFNEEAQANESEQLNAVRGTVYFALLEYCVKHRDVVELQLLLELKPVHVSVLHVLRALRNHLPQKVVKKSENEGSGGVEEEQVTVGKLRPVLLALLKQQKAAPVQVA